MVSIRHDYKLHYVGSFAVEEEAAMAYDKRCWEIKGNKAKLNFPDLIPRTELATNPIVEDLQLTS